MIDQDALWEGGPAVTRDDGGRVLVVMQAASCRAG